ncbi:MAG: rhodanese-like domain-containing protein [Crocinitomicaceae bacterium]|nr:rhodanese-like domain-containing protein [Crocinitomicaceae bacterium]
MPTLNAESNPLTMQHMVVRITILLTFLNGYSAKGQTGEYETMLQQYYDDFPTISVYGLKYKMDSGEVFLLDTREEDEYDISHLENAIQVGYEDFDLTTVSFLPKDSEIIVYCSIGARSQEIGEIVKQAGYTNVFNLYGGIFYWSNIGCPIVDEAGDETSNIHGYSEDWGKWITNATITY